jgi:hypothetical protein
LTRRVGRFHPRNSNLNSKPNANHNARGNSNQNSRGDAKANSNPNSKANAMGDSNPNTKGDSNPKSNGGAFSAPHLPFIGALGSPDIAGILADGPAATLPNFPISISNQMDGICPSLSVSIGVHPWLKMDRHSRHSRDNGCLPNPRI